MANPLQYWRRVLSRPNDDRIKTIAVATLVALCSAIVVSTTSVALKPIQDANIQAERQARMDLMLDTLPGLRELMLKAGVDALESRIVDLTDGSFSEGIDPARYDMGKAAEDPETSIELSTDDDIAGLKRRANFAPIYLLQSNEELKIIVLPVQGAGYQSTITAMLALEADLTTIAALSIVEQGDSPGLGARIEDPEWLALWPGTKIVDADGNISVSVVRGKATEPYEVDGISGATRTGNGITNMLRFWLGENGYGPFLERLKSEGL